MPAPSSYTLGPTPEGVRPIRLSRATFAKAREAAIDWVGSEPNLVGVDAALTKCYGQGLIGISQAILEIIAGCAQEARRTTPILLIGGPGTELVAAAESIHFLGMDEHETDTAASQPFRVVSCQGLTASFAQRAPGGYWPRSLARRGGGGVGLSEFDMAAISASGGTLVFKDFETAPLEVQRQTRPPKRWGVDRRNVKVGTLIQMDLTHPAEHRRRASDACA
jgi:hypothetical protein